MSVASSSTEKNPFVGRESELTELTSALEGVLGGSGQLVMIAGDPGIGKTRLTEELADSAREKGFEVHWGRSYEDTGAPPYWSWIQILRSFSGSRDHDEVLQGMGDSASVIADIFPDLKSWDPDIKPPVAESDPESARFRLFDATSTFLTGISQDQPMMLILDDVHWADAPTLQLLQFFARYVADSRIIVVGTYRDTELSRRHPLSKTLADLNRERNYTRHLLRGLDENEIRQLIDELGHDGAASGISAEIVSQTQGNPFFVREIAYELASDDKSASLVRIPEGVREVVGQRLNRISEEANDLLTNAAVIGLEFDYQVLTRITKNQTEDDVVDLLEEATAAHLVEIGDVFGRYRFAHALVRQTLLDETSPVGQVRLHARIAAEMESLYGDSADQHAAELAHHFAEADLSGESERVVHYSTIAGEHAFAVHAQSQAAVHFERALNALPEDAPWSQQAELHYGLARSYLQILDRHELQRAVDELRSAFDAFIEAGDEETALEVALTPFPPVHGPVGLPEMLTRAIPLAESGSISHGMLLGALLRAIGYEGNGDPDRTKPLFDEALELAEKLDDDRLRLWILIHTIAVHIRGDDFDSMGERVEQAAQLSVELGDDNAEFVSKEVLTDAILGKGEYDRAEQLGVEALEAARRTRNRFNITTALSVLAGVKLVKGDWASADELLDEGLNIIPDESRVLQLKLMSLGERGYFEEATELALRLNSVGRRPQVWVAIMAFAIRGSTLLLRLGADSPIDMLLLEKIRSIDSEWFADSSSGIRMVNAAVGLATGDLSLMQEGLATYQPLKNFFRRGPIRCSVQHIAPALHQIGRTDEAVESFESGLEYCRKLGDRPGIVWLNTDYIELLLDRNGPGDYERAVDLRDEAVAIAEELGMKPHLGMLEKHSERLDALEPTVDSGGADSNGAVNPDGLSDREVEVLQLIAAGHSNQRIADELFLSRYTIVRHVANIFSKTGVANRTEAATYANQSGLIDE